MANGEDLSQKEKIAKLAQEIKDANEITAKTQEEINKLSQIELNLLSQRKDLHEDITKELKRQIDHDALKLENLEQEALRTAEYANQVKALGNSLEENNLKHKAALDYHNTEISLLQEMLKQGKGNTAEINKQILAHEKKKRKINETKKSVDAVHDRLKRVSGQNTKLVKGFKEMGAAMRMGPVATAGMLTNVIGGPLLKFGLGLLRKAFNMLKTAVVDAFFAIDNVTHAFDRATHMGDRYNQGMIRNWQETRHLGVTMEDLSGATQSLIANLSDFTLESDAAGTSVARTISVMEKLGIKADDITKGMQISMKAFGQSMMGAEETARQLLSTSEALGIPPQQLASDYARMGGQLAKLGRDGPRAFQELARVSKITGLEMEKVLQITDKFDTFEGAATQAGQLNAALGGNFVNAMDMMMTTDPVQRFEQLRDAITSTGLTFDDMSYYQRQFYTNALGLNDVSELAMMMSGNMDQLAGGTQKSAAEYEEMAAQAETMMSLQEKFNAFMAQLAPVLEELMEKAHGWMDALRRNEPLIISIRNAVRLLAEKLVWLAENWEDVLYWLKVIPIAIIGVSFAMKGLTLLTNIQMAANVRRIAQSRILVRSIKAEGRSALVTGRQMRTGSRGVGAFAIKMGILAVAIGAITGGIGYMAHGMAELFGAISAEKVASFGAFVGTLSTTAPLAVAAMAPLAEAFQQLGESMSGISSDKLDKLKDLGTELSAAQADADATAGQMLREVAVALKEVPEERVSGFASVMMNTSMALVAANALLQGGGFKGNQNTPSSGESSPTEAGGLMGTIELTFNPDNKRVFNNKVIEIFEQEHGKKVARAQHGDE
tara:strand:+ start:2542 stop:5043 length:2502 start_codon:yes stop_codon:yes gene_type:complete